MPDTMVLTDEQKRQYLESGYVVVRGALCSDTMSALDAEIARVVADKPANGAADYYYEDSVTTPGRRLLRRVERLSQASDVVNDLFHSHAVLGAVSELFGEPAVLFKDKLNMKLPGGAGFRAHVDGHFHWTDEAGREREGWLEHGTWFINAFVCMDAANRANGCLEIAPLVQTFELMGRTFDEILARVDGRGPDVTPEHEALVDLRPVEVEPGDLVFFDWRCIHRSRPNLDTAPRRILYATYNRRSEGEQMAAYYDGKHRSAEPIARKSLGRPGLA